MGFPTAVHTAAGWDVRTRSTSWNIFEHTSPKQQLKSKTTTTGIKRFCCSAAHPWANPCFFIHRLPAGYLWIPGGWGPGLVQGQEVPDVQDALLLLLNTAISWGRGGSTAPPLHQRAANCKAGFVSPLWASAAPTLSGASSQTEPATKPDNIWEGHCHCASQKIYLPPLCLLEGYFSRCHTISHSFSKVCI